MFGNFSKSHNKKCLFCRTSGELDYWVHSEHIESRDDYFYTDCGSLIFPLVVKTTLKPTTATTSTPTPTTQNKTTAAAVTTRKHSTTTTITKHSTFQSHGSTANSKPTIHSTAGQTANATTLPSSLTTKRRSSTASTSTITTTTTRQGSTHHHTVTGHTVKMESGP